MTLEMLIGPLSRVICCLVPIGWLPALLVLYVTRRRGSNTNRQSLDRVMKGIDDG